MCGPTIAAALAATVVLAQAVFSADVPDHSLATYLAFAHEHNPMMTMARKEAQATALESKAAGALAGPSLMVESEHQGGGWMPPMIGAAQTFPWPGEARWKRRVASLQSEAAGYQVDQAWIEISFEIREAYGMLYETGKTIQNQQESLALVRRIAEIAQINYAAGKGSQSALLILQIEAARTEDRIRSLELSGQKARFKLAELCATPEALAAPYPSELPRLAVPRDLDEIRRIATASNPAVLQRKKDAEAALARVRMERSAAAPMFRVEGSFGPSAAMDGRAWKIGVEAMLPLWPLAASRMVGAARSMADAASAKAESESASLRKDAEVWFMEYQDRVRKIALLDSVLVPRAQQMVELMMQEYRVGMVPLGDVVDAQRMYLMQKTDRVMEEVAREMAAAEIVVCCLALF